MYLVTSTNLCMQMDFNEPRSLFDGSQICSNFSVQVQKRIKIPLILNRWCDDFPNRHKLATFRFSNSPPILWPPFLKVHNNLAIQAFTFWRWPSPSWIFRKLLPWSILFTSSYATIHFPFYLQHFSYFQFGHFWVFLWRELIFFQYKIWSFWIIYIGKIRQCVLCFHHVRIDTHYDQYYCATSFLGSYCQHYCKVWNYRDLLTLSHCWTGENSLRNDLSWVLVFDPWACVCAWGTMESYQ